MQRELRYQLGIVIAAGIVFFTNLGAVALWDEDEPIYASCAREMLTAGDWVVPTFNGEVFPEKPPLMFWLMISAYQLFGVTEFAARWWSAVLGCGTAILTYHLGKRLFRPSVGLWAGIIVATSLIFTVSARAATVDAALVFFTTLAVLLFVAGSSQQRAAADNQDRSTWLPDSWLVLVLFYACLGAAVLTKGPVGVALPVIMICAFLWLLDVRQVSAHARRSEGDLFTRLAALLQVLTPRTFGHVIWRMRPLTAVLVVALINAPWIVLVSLRTDGAWMAQFLGEQNLGRALKPLQGHSGAVYYYLLAIMIGFFPWSVFLGPALTSAWQRRKEEPSGEQASVLLVLCWLVVFVGLWSIPSTKLPHYVLTAYPALALLTAWFVDGWIRDPARYSRWWLRSATLTLVAVGALTTVALPVATSYFIPLDWQLGLAGPVLIIGGLLAWYFAERLQTSRAMITLATTAVVFLTALFGFAAQRVDQYQNSPFITAAIRDASCGQPQLATYRYFRESLVFYADAEVSHCGSSDAVDEFLQQAHHPYVLTTDAHERELLDRFPGTFEVLLRRPRFLHDGQVVVLAARPQDHLHSAVSETTPTTLRTARH